MATREDLIALLPSSALPNEAGEELLAAVSDFWLLSGPPDVLVDDLARCHPPLAVGEVRVEFRLASASGRRRLTVVAHDRPGLLAATTGTLASAGLSVLAASVATWTDRELALHGLDVTDPGWGDEQWIDLAAQTADAVRAVQEPTVKFKPAGEVKVVCAPAAIDHTLVTVDAPDRIGLLWAITSWFAAAGTSVVAAHLDAEGGRAKDVFLVTGQPRPDELVARLAGRRAARMLRG